MNAMNIGHGERVQPSEDPVVSAYHDWLDARREGHRIAYDTPEGIDDPAHAEAMDREDAAFDAMVAAVPTTMEGIKALAHLILETGGPDWCRGSPEWEEEWAGRWNKPKLALWRALSGQEGPPNY